MTDSTASPYDPDAALLLARIRAAGSAPAEVAASTAAAAARAAAQVDRELIEVAVPGGAQRILTLGWGEGAAPDPGRHPSALPRQLPPVPLLTLRCPRFSGQGSNRILIWKGTGSSAGQTETIHFRV